MKIWIVCDKDNEDGQSLTPFFSLKQAEKYLDDNKEHDAWLFEGCGTYIQGDAALSSLNSERIHELEEENARYWEQIERLENQVKSMRDALNREGIDDAY